jgi:hypothetical protein
MTTAIGCHRPGALRRRLDAIEDPTARRVLSDCLWHHGSIYRWDDVEAIRFEADFVEHTGMGDVTTPEVWLLEARDGHVRIEQAGPRSASPPATMVFDGRRIRLYSGREQVRDAGLLAGAAGRIRMVRELAPLPFSALAKDRRFAYGGLERGPAETRAWHRLRMIYDEDDAGSMVLRVRDGTRQATGADVRWPDVPFGGRTLRVEMDDWRPVGGLLLAHRWRLRAMEEGGEPVGPALYTVRVERIELNPDVPRDAFKEP